MPTLKVLRDTWFLDVSPGGFPPQTRHPGTLLERYTDGNFVEALIDGSTVMDNFHQEVTRMTTAPDPSKHELWIASWRLDPVKLLGETNTAEDAEEAILKAAAAGVKVFYLGSGHVYRDSDAQDFAKKLKAKGSNGSSDKRFPLWGSHHQKFYVFRGPGNEWVAIVGSVDLSYTRWDTPLHLENNPDRPEKEGHATHDVAVRVRGPAVRDIALTFADRWNDATNRNRTDPKITTSIPTDFASTPIPVAAAQSVQVLRTYPIEKDRGYAWSAQGEFTIWAAYLNAIKRADHYIYIEDQYFYTFDDPPAIEVSAGSKRDSDLVYQLGEALKRGVDVVVLVPGRTEDWGACYQLHQRGKAAHYLRKIADNQVGGRFVICSLKVGNKEPVVHSKLMILDDEFVLVGSANFCQRSMAHDSEIHLGIVDANNLFARNLRIALWKEHMQIEDDASILDPSVGVGNFLANATGGMGRLRVFSTTDPGLAPCCHGTMLKHTIDPYHGPIRS